LRAAKIFAANTIDLGDSSSRWRSRPRTSIPLAAHLVHRHPTLFQSLAVDSGEIGFERRAVKVGMLLQMLDAFHHECSDLIFLVHRRLLNFPMDAEGIVHLNGGMAPGFLFDAGERKRTSLGDIVRPCSLRFQVETLRDLRRSVLLEIGPSWSSDGTRSQQVLSRIDPLKKNNSKLDRKMLETCLQNLFHDDLVALNRSTAITVPMIYDKWLASDLLRAFTD
jgi:hypothetical protein